MSADSKRPLFLAIQFIDFSLPVKLDYVLTRQELGCSKSRRIIGLVKTRPCESVVTSPSPQTENSRRLLQQSFSFRN